MADPVSLAITVALTAAQMAITASQHIEGPRLKDLSTTVADYGTPLNYLRGTRWLTGACFYAEPIREFFEERKGKGGKQTNYTYSGTWAIAVADHEVAAIRKIKFDGHLVYDATSAGETYPLADDYTLASHIRFYLGTETQDPDPRMLATVEARDGAGTCPAYRGLSYIFFEDIPLEKLGNRLPVVTFEVATTIDAQAVVLDFENGVYTIGGESRTAAEIFEATVSDPEDFDLADIVAGQGYGKTVTGLPGLEAKMMLTDEVSSAIVAGGLDTGYSAIIDFYLSKTASGGEAEIALAYETYTGYPTDTWRAIGVLDTLPTTANSKAAVHDWSYLSYPATWGVVSPITAGEHRFETHFSTSGFTYSLDGSVPATTSAPHPIITSGPRRFFLYARAGPNWYDDSATAWIRRVEFPAPAAASLTLGDVLTDLALMARLDPSEFDFSALDQEISGYSWTQGTVKQIADPLLDVYDSDLRPHDFVIQGVKRGGASQGTISASEFVAADPRYTLPDPSDSDLPRRITVTFADLAADQQANTAVAQRSASATASAREMGLDMSTLALAAGDARQLVDRYHRRTWFARGSAGLGLTRQRIGIEPADVWTLDFDGHAVTMRCAKLAIGADGTIKSEWVEDDPVLAALSGAAGAPAAGIPPAVLFDPAVSAGAVLDLPLLADAHDRAAPFAYVVAGAADAKSFPGADVAISDTGVAGTFAQGWTAIPASDSAAIGTMSDTLGNAAPWLIDYGSSVEVVLNSGTLTSSSEDAVLADGGLNLCLIGDELVQFITATLTAPLTYSLTGLVRGARGTERFIATHAAAERFILLDSKVHLRTMGAGEIGDTDSYIVTSVGQAPDEGAAFDLAFTAAAHKPLAPVHGSATLAGGDWTVTATRRTRIGGATLNGQDVPLGEASESWEADVMDGATVKRTLTGTSLPLTYTAAQQVTDWGGAQSSLTVRLYQKNPTLSLRGFPLEITG